MIKKTEQGNFIIIWNDKNNKCVDVTKFKDYMLGTYRTCYRIDYQGTTVGLEPTMRDVMKIAKKYIL